MDVDVKRKQNKYVSCIKIKGIQLLPPVIDNKRRSELLKYKQQAIKLEKRLENCRELKKNLEELLSLQTLSDRPISAVTFGDNSHLDALGLATSRRNSYSKRPMKLSHDIVDVSEYSSDGIKIIDCETGTNCTDSSEGHPQHDEEYNGSDTGPIIDNCVDQICPPVLDLSGIIESTRSSSLNNTSQNDQISSTKPKLIRSNSYTLEAPSPILLAHLERHSNIEQLKNESHRSSSESGDIPNSIPLENSEFSSMNTVYNNSINKTEEYQNKNSSPRIEVIQTDISVQQITVNGDSGMNETTLEKYMNSSDIDNSLIEVLRTLPKEYSQQIIEQIEKQCSERISKAELSQIAENQSVGPTSSHNEHQEYRYFDNQSCMSRYSLSPSQSIDYSVSVSGTLVPTTPCSGLINLECGQDMANEKFNMTRACLQYFQENSSPRPARKSHKGLFPRYNDEQEWAASIICAHVRGYLTRRMLKTERVQNLIETIKDALLCAIQLHNAENIDESDVELHRRLMNQVSAACCAFHDIFFSLSVSEQMSVIAMDRQKKIEKAKRPLSAPTPRRSRSNSSRSSTKSLTPMSRSMTKI